MCNKIKQIYKGVSTCGSDYFLEERVIREQPLPIAASRRTSLVAGWTHQWASEVSGNEGQGRH